VGNKPRNVDSIVKPIKGSATQPPKSNDEPLLSIIEPIQPEIKGKKLKPKKPKPEEKLVKTSFLKRHHKMIVITTSIFISLLVLAGLVGGAAYAQQKMYENKIFPGVVVWGEDVGGKSVAEVQQIILAKVKAYSLTIKGPDQNYVATATDLGLNFKAEDMALSAYSVGRNGSFFSNYIVRARLLVTKIPWEPLQKIIGINNLSIPPNYIISESTFNQYVSKVVSNINIDPQDSQVSVVSGQVQLKPAIYGRNVMTDDLKQQVRDSLNSFSSKEVIVQTVSVKPTIVDDTAQDTVIQAQSVMTRPVILTYNGQDYRPNQETIASWISFIKNPGDTKYTLIIDKSKMSSYLDYLGTQININPIDRKVTVENGDKQTETQAGVNGLMVDTTVLGNSIASLLPNQASVTLTIPTYVAQFTTDYQQIVVADWDKYIDINLTTQTMIACEKGGVNCKQWSVTTGDDNHSTPTGTTLVLGRSANFYMNGFNANGSAYHLWVDHATWFRAGGYAIHDAHWRSTFGGQDYHYDGSHGCINAPDDAAIYIYNWADVGTPVTVHY
jgi:lipoprotein-anchoring transpeptidase ErfK/SrfK